jgi:toxic protein SymE
MSSSARTIRKAKLHGHYQQSADQWNGVRNVPWLNLRGLWLEDAGFNVGDAIEIVVHKKRLVIKKASVKR